MEPSWLGSKLWEASVYGRGDELSLNQAIELMQIPLKSWIIGMNPAAKVSTICAEWNHTAPHQIRLCKQAGVNAYHERSGPKGEQRSHLKPVIFNRNHGDDVLNSKYRHEGCGGSWNGLWSLGWQMSSATQRNGLVISAWMPSILARSKHEKMGPKVGVIASWPLRPLNVWSIIGRWCICKKPIPPLLSMFNWA